MINRSRLGKKVLRHRTEMSRKKVEKIETSRKNFKKVKKEYLTNLDINSVPDNKKSLADCSTSFLK